MKRSFSVFLIDIPSARHLVFVENGMNWRTVAGRGRPIGRKKDMKGTAEAISR